MSGEPAARSRAAFNALWLAAATLLLFVVAWPVVGGERATNDDLKFVRVTEFAGDPLGAVVAAWRTGHLFRPVEILLGATCDPQTLSPGWAVAVQSVGLAVVIASVVSLGRMAAPGKAAVGPLAVTFLLLSPGTTNAVWQMDAASQTWSAALGTAAVAVAWSAADRALTGRSILAHALGLGAVFLVGCSVKETFYGWSAAIGGALGITAILAIRRRLPGAAGLAWLLLPTVALPVVHLALRITTGALGAADPGAEGTRYQAEFGLNLVVNAAFSVAGSIANGPFHAVTDSSASPLVRSLPLVTALFLFGAIIVAGGLAWIHRAWGPRDLVRAAGVAAVCLASTVATVSAGSVSELHCFGANAGFSVLVAVAMVSLWHPASVDERMIGRTVAGASFVVAVAIGSFGLAGRAYHHWITWQYARLTNDAILAHAASVEPVDPDSGRAAGVIYLSSPCILGRTYGQYVIPPAQAIGLDSTQPWLLKRDPTRPIVFSVNAPPGVLRPGDMVLDCSTMPKRASW